MSNRSQWIGLALAAVAALVAAVALFVRPEGPGPEVVPAEAPPVTAPKTAAPQDLGTFAGATKGGYYEGRVLDAADDSPVPDADVILGGKAEIEKKVIEGSEQITGGEPIEIQVVGDVKTVARAKTDALGRFRLAGGEAPVVFLFAYAKGFAPTLKAHTTDEPLKPGNDHVIRMKRPGHLRGHVVDAVTKEPVPYAKVEILLQTKANQEHLGVDAFTPENSFSKYFRWVREELGPIVWDTAPKEGDQGFTLSTGRDGTFDFGPLTEQVQVEVIVTHPEYKWTEFDPDVTFKGLPSDQSKPVKRRLVIPPGQTVEKTYELVKGKEVKGRVVDQSKRPVAGVDVSLEHVVQYAQHWMYRVRARRTTTDENGRFRIAGLDYGPYSIRMEHPSFDTAYFSGVKEGSDVEYRIETGGWIGGAIEGGQTDKPLFQVDVFLAPQDSKGPTRQARVAVHERRYAVEKVKPGRYLVWAKTGGWVSTPATVEVDSETGATADLRLTMGGGLEVQIRDHDGAAVDPAVADLEAILEDGSLRMAGSLVSRGGLAHASGLLPGRYRVKARANGFVATTSETVEVKPEGYVVVAPIVLPRQSWLQVVSVSKDAPGRPVAGMEVHLSLSQDGGEFVPLLPLTLGRIPVQPGRVTLKGIATDGREFEGTYDVNEGETVRVEIVLSERK